MQIVMDDGHQTVRRYGERQVSQTLAVAQLAEHQDKQLVPARE